MKTVKCPECGFTGSEEDFDAEVKQEFRGNNSYTNIGFGCRRCGAKWW